MSNSIIRLTNSCLNRKMTTPSVMVQFSPGQAVTVGHDLVLAFFINHQLDQSAFRAGCAQRWIIDAELASSRASKSFSMREGDVIELPQDKVKIWPVAFDIDIHSHQVRKILTRIAPLDAIKSIDNIPNLNR